MARLPDSELVRLVTEVRPFADPETAIAVILGESGGDPSAVNRQPDNIDRGLWQISSKWHPNVSDVQAFDPVASTRYAFDLSSGGTDFNAWHATRAATFAGHRQTAAAMLGATGSGRFGGASATVGEFPLDGQGVGGEVDMTVSPVDIAKDAARRAAGLAGSVTGGIGDVIGFLAKGLSVLVSADFWKRAGYVVAGVVLLYLGLAAIFGRDALAIGTTVASKGTVSLPANSDAD